MKKIYSLIGAIAIAACANAQTSSRTINTTQTKNIPMPSQIVSSVATTTTTMLVPTSVTTCTSDIHILSVGSGTAYVGYLAGSNAYGDLQKAQAYNLTTYGLTTPATVAGVQAYIGYKTGTGTITAHVYSDNSGAVGTMMGTSLPVSVAAINTSSLTAFTFTTPVALTGSKFYVSVDFSTLGAGDTIAIASTQTCTANGSGAWEQQSSNSWYNFTDATNSWGASATMDLLIFPVINATVAGIHEANTAVTNLNVYPNPAGAEVNLAFNMKNSANVEVEIYTMTGKLVKVIPAQYLNAGSNVLNVDATNLESGMYMYSVKVDNTKSFGKFSIAK